MNTFTIVVLCLQACLIQHAFSQCTSRAAVSDASGLLGSAALASPYGLGSPLAYGAGCAGRQPCPMGYPDTGRYAVCPLGYGAGSSYPGAPYGAGPYGNAAAPYGGSGEGNVAVAGELPVNGNTAVTGQVPIMGAVQFSGPVSAAGTVSIIGKCACGCGSPYIV